jgi:hypothetical protein
MQPSSRRRFRRPRALIVASSVMFVTALVTSPLAQALIMRDGGVCDPIRHMGC